MKFRMLESLEQEALKYKTAEDFAKATMYHGSNSSNPLISSENSYGSSVDNLGFYLTDDKSWASEFGSQVHQMFSNLKNPLVVKADDLQAFHYREFMKMKKEGKYDGIIIKPYTDPYAISDARYNADYNYETHIVFDRNQPKTKDQLVDIWKQTHHEI